MQCDEGEQPLAALRHFTPLPRHRHIWTTEQMQNGGFDRITADRGGRHWSTRHEPSFHRGALAPRYAGGRHRGVTPRASKITPLPRAVTRRGDCAVVRARAAGAASAMVSATSLS